MPDFGSPVVNANTAYDPSQSVQTLQGVMGVQQQRQALQTGQYLQQSAQAKSLQDQVDAQKQQIAFNEQQSLGKLDIKKYIGKDGVYDADAYTKDALQAAPMSGLGQERSKNMYEIRGEQLKVQSAAQSLNAEKRKDVTNNLLNAAETIKEPVDLLKFAEDQKKVNPGASDVWDSVMGTMKPDDTIDQVKGKLHVLNAAVHGMDTPITGSFTNEKGEQEGSKQSPISGNLTASSGGPAKLGLSPTEKPEYKAAVTKATGLTGSQVEIDSQRAKDVGTIAQNAPGQIKLTQQADRLVNAIQSGKFPAWTAEQLKNAGSDDPAVVARAELKKVLGQLKDSATSHAGSDKQLSTQLEQFPDETSPNEVVHSRMDNLRGTYRLSQERKDNFNAYQTKHGLGGFQQSDDMLTSSRDPQTAELHALPKGSQERREFLKRTYKGDSNAMQDAIEREQASYHTVGNGSGK